MGGGADTGQAGQAEAGLAPVATRERLAALDTLRGFSLLGILLMNIVSFGLPMQAYMDPSVAGGDSPLNLIVWFVNYVLFEGKMRAIFSMLFGAGVILLTSRGEERGGGIAVADVYYRRMLWLLLFGLLHAFFLWMGDILYSYAIGGLFLFPLRKLRPWILIAAGVAVSAALSPLAILLAMDMEHTRKMGEAALAAAAAGKTLNEEQQEAKKAWEEKKKEAKPSPRQLAEETQVHQGGYWGLFLFRAGVVVRVQSLFFYKFGFFDVLAMMLIGMGLMKLGVLSAARSVRFYVVMMVLGYGIGLPIKAVRGITFWWRDFDPATLSYGFALDSVDRLAAALGHIALLMLVLKAGKLAWLTSRLAAVGQMALTNYLGHTVICTTLFEGYGLGWFNQLDRYQLYVVVLAVWAFQLLVSPIWLRYFRFGPMEWVWRSLTYWKLQPMWRGGEAAAADAPLGDVEKEVSPLESSAQSPAGPERGEDDSMTDRPAAHRKEHDLSRREGT